MSEEQFEDMFMKLDDYTAKIYTQNMVYDGIKAQINEKSMDFNSYVIVIEAGKKIPCNCEWTCSDFCDRPTRNCKMTSSGCGFMWAFECTQAC